MGSHGAAASHIEQRLCFDAVPQRLIARSVKSLAGLLQCLTSIIGVHIMPTQGHPCRS